MPCFVVDGLIKWLTLYKKVEICKCINNYKKTIMSVQPFPSDRVAKNGQYDIDHANSAGQAAVSQADKFNAFTEYLAIAAGFCAFNAVWNKAGQEDGDADDAWVVQTLHRSNKAQDDAIATVRACLTVDTVMKEYDVVVAAFIRTLK